MCTLKQKSVFIIYFFNNYIPLTSMLKVYNTEPNKIDYKFSSK